jgi:iron complex transport system ATP-binding protein
MSLEIKNLVCGYGGRPVGDPISLTVRPGEVLCVLGPNGVGKTTFFRTVLGFLPPLDGTALWKGVPIHSGSHKERARLVAYVPQTHAPPFPYRVREVVVMGRAAHQPAFRDPSPADYDICDEMLRRLKIEHLRDRIYTKISGGERQMALIARALAQQPALMLMDEPTSDLDYGNQLKVLRQIVDLAGEGLAIMMTTHSPDQAALCGTTVALFQAGGPMLLGRPDEIINEENLKTAYGVDVKMFAYLDERGRRVKVCAPMMNNINS